MKTRIHSCKCLHTIQDAMYGRGNRVWNFAPTQKKPSPSRWRCTVCGEVKEF